MIGYPPLFSRQVADTKNLSPVALPGFPLGVQTMRSNSGKDEGRNNLHDEALSDAELGRVKPAVTGKKPNAPADHRQGRKD